MRLVLVCMCVAVVVLAAFGGGKTTAQAPSVVARGKYLVEDAGKCQDCHSPRNEKGEFIKERWLQGTPLAFKAAVPMPAFADKAPDITGLMGWSKADGIRFFMTGKTTQGLQARPPMPDYRFTRADSEAITAYLISLKPGAGKK